MDMHDKQLAKDYTQASDELLAEVSNGGTLVHDLPLHAVQANLTLSDQLAATLNVESSLIHQKMLYLSWIHNRVRIIREERAARLSNLN